MVSLVESSSHTVTVGITVMPLAATAAEVMAEAEAAVAVEGPQ